MRSDRAKQFMPFAALRGYYDLILEKEKFKEPRRELSEEQVEEISRVLRELECGKIVQVTFYKEDSYETIVGVVSKICIQEKILCVVKELINFDNIIDVRMI